VMACKEFGIDVRGTIINKMPKKPSLVEQKAPEVMERLTGVPVMCTLPFSRGGDYVTIGKALEKTIDFNSLLSR
jgi:cobyric acid synthase